MISPLSPLNIKTNVRAERAGSCPHTVTLFVLAPDADWSHSFEFTPQLAIWQQEAAAEHNSQFPGISTP